MTERGLSTPEETVGVLAAADVLGLDGQRRIRKAYPFSPSPTAHEVAITGGPRVYAICAIDALGIPAMLHAYAVIAPSDPLTGEPVTVTVAGAKASWHPPGAVAFAGRAHGGAPAGKVSYGYLNFFTTPPLPGNGPASTPRANSSPSLRPRPFQQPARLAEPGLISPVTRHLLVGCGGVTGRRAGIGDHHADRDRAR